MAYFEPYVDGDGIHVPTYDDILEYLIAQYKTIFGDDAYLGEETPDYQMLSVFAKCVGDFSALAIQAYNNRNPQYASGDALDILVRLTGLNRREATYSHAVLTVSGTEATVIPAGSKVIDDQGILWVTDGSVTIPAAGETTVNATCETAGAILAPAGTITGIYTPVPGWTGVTNTDVANGGLDTETDAELRNRFYDAHVLTESGITGSIVSGLRRITGVTQVSIIENNTDTDNTGSGGLPPHSFCSIVTGGDEDDIAERIFALKAPGVATYGSTSKTVMDAFGNSNTVKFSRPTTTTVSITVNITPLSGYDADRIDEIIKESLIADIKSLGIGKSWNVTMGYKDIYSQFDSTDLPFVVTSISSSNAVNGVVPCSFDHVLSTDAAHISIVTPQ